jgi:hypothetical protein
LSSLREYLAEWTDPDVAMYYVGCCLGLFPPPDAEKAGFLAVKGILWSSNEIEETLELVMKRLFRNGALLLDEEKGRYRWNESYSIERAL